MSQSDHNSTAIENNSSTSTKDESLTRTKTEQLPTKISLEELQSCQFSSWYPSFRNLHKRNDTTVQNNDDKGEETTMYCPYRFKNVTIKSVILKPLPKEFVDYLKRDGMKLPKGAEHLSSFLPDDIDQRDNDDWSSDEEGNDNDGKEHNENDSNSYDEENGEEDDFHFPILNQQIQDGIKSLGGSVLPKLNWSAPKDVTWLNVSTMKCSTVGDVYLMLKSSDFCMHDLIHALDNLDDVTTMGQKEVAIDVKDKKPNVEYELILRKWCNLHPSMEFRCFVGNYELVAISQRHHTQHYPHLSHDKTNLQECITDFYEGAIRENYASKRISNYVFDIYVDKNNRVWLIDFNLWNIQTDALLFNWEELVDMIPGQSNGVEDTTVQQLMETNDAKPEIRIVNTENEVRHDPLSSYRGPVDAVNLASDKSGVLSFEKFMNMCQKPSERQDKI